MVWWKTFLGESRAQARCRLVKSRRGAEKHFDEARPIMSKGATVPLVFSLSSLYLTSTSAIEL
jgi:hypothetical protein